MHEFIVCVHVQTGQQLFVGGRLLFSVDAPQQVTQQLALLGLHIHHTNTNQFLWHSQRGTPGELWSHGVLEVVLVNLMVGGSPTIRWDHN